MKRIVIGFVFFMALISPSLAQEDDSYWGDLLLEEINQLRDSLGLSQLKQDVILEAAAFDQVSYCLELGKLVHEQDNDKKANVYKRVMYYEGLQSSIEENLAEITFGASEALLPNGIREEIDSDEKLVKAVLASWLEDEKSSKLNVLDPDFYTIGISVLVENEVDHIFCVVFGNNPYSPFGDEKLNHKNYGIDPFDKEKCKTFLEDFPTIRSLFSDALQVDGEQVKLSYHSLPFMKQVLNSSSDALALDWIDASQYKCSEGNQNFPGSIATGYLQKPFKKAFLFAQNIADSIQELKVPLGRVPSFYKEQNTEVNLLFIKDGVHCATVPFNKVIAKNTRQMNLKFAVAGESDKSIFEWEDSISFSFNLLNNGFDSLQLARERLASINFKKEFESLVVQVSPIHQELLADIPEVPQRTHIAWDSLAAFTKNTYYQLDMAELDQAGQLEYLKTTSLEDENLRSFLNGLNKIQVAVKGKASFDLTEEVNKQLELYQFFLSNNQIAPALFVQAKLLKQVRKGELKPDELPKADPSQKENTLAVINNQIVLEHLMGATSYGGNPIYLAFFELYLINQQEPEVSFNYHAAKLQYWSEHSLEIKGVEKWLTDFKKINSNNILPQKYARTLLNYNMLAVDYYYENQNFTKRKKSFVELMKWAGKVNLSESEGLDLAKTLVYQDQIALAVQLLKPSISKEVVSKESLFYFLQIAIYDKGIVSAAEYLKHLEKAQKLYPKQFCKLFSKSKMGKQQLENLEIKKLYCGTCL